MANNNLDVPRKQSITGTGQRTQSVSGPATQEFVRVAVLPPRLPADIAPPTGVGAAEAFSWDESVNWKHNQKINQPEPSSSKKWFRKAGLTTQREKANEMPPFIMREVPYDIWRKHYAKDAEGRYKGTLAPAEDCLLLPEDVEKWSYGPAETYADKWTRGKAALPVYDQAQNHPADELPVYSKDDSTVQPVDESKQQSAAARTASTSSFTADGKNTQEIIDEAKAKAKTKEGKQSWRDRVRRGTEFALMGAGN